tara:strand:- start:299 stop:442 length:144 start_codon:yes stop_codon:yes gene_type:complete
VDQKQTKRITFKNQSDSLSQNKNQTATKAKEISQDDFYQKRSKSESS